MIDRLFDNNDRWIEWLNEIIVMNLSGSRVPVRQDRVAHLSQGIPAQEVEKELEEELEESEEKNASHQIVIPDGRPAKRKGSSSKWDSLTRRWICCSCLGTTTTWTKSLLLSSIIERFHSLIDPWSYHYYFINRKGWHLIDFKGGGEEKKKKKEKEKNKSKENKKERIHIIYTIGDFYVWCYSRKRCCF